MHRDAHRDGRCVAIHRAPVNRLHGYGVADPIPYFDMSMITRHGGISWPDDFDFFLPDLVGAGCASKVIIVEVLRAISDLVHAGIRAATSGTWCNSKTDTG